MTYQKLRDKAREASKGEKKMSDLGDGKDSKHLNFKNRNGIVLHRQREIHIKWHREIQLPVLTHVP